MRMLLCLKTTSLLSVTKTMWKSKFSWKSSTTTIPFLTPTSQESRFRCLKQTLTILGLRINLIKYITMERLSQREVWTTSSELAILIGMLLLNYSRFPLALALPLKSQERTLFWLMFKTISLYLSLAKSARTLTWVLPISLWPFIKPSPSV